MSLWPIKTIEPIWEYELCDGSGGIYAPKLCAEPIIYKETLTSFGHFFYEPSSDRLVAFATMGQKAWPGWNAVRLEWDPETGEMLSRALSGIWATAWHQHATLGSFNQIFDLDVLGHPEAVDPFINWVSPMWRRDDISLSYAVVNLQDNLLAGVSSFDLNIYDLTKSPPELKASMRLPNTLGYLCMESREICWVITRDGLIVKANYKSNPPRWEMLSSVQNPSPDAINYLITWDQKRGRLVVLRQRPDAADGACQCQLEFYRPLIKVAGITDPVPMSNPLSGKQTEFVAHLYGQSGEGVSPYRVVAALQTPASGIMLQAESISTQNGAVSFLYQGPEAAGEETLILEATINDGES